MNRTVPLKGVRRGFTLIELLVVIAIIAILAAVLFPVFAKARDKARQTACLNNCKQLGLALLQYVQDNEENSPNWTYGSLTSPQYPLDMSQDGGKGDKWWQTPAPQLLPYIKSTQVFVCPTKGRGGPDPSVTHTQSYSYNYIGCFSGPFGKIPEPSSTIAITEDGNGPWLDAFFPVSSYPDYHFGNSGDSRWQTQHGKHVGGMIN